jgi:hypothetical protein
MKKKIVGTIFFIMLLCLLLSTTAMANPGNGLSEKNIKSGFASILAELTYNDPTGGYIPKLDDVYCRLELNGTTIFTKKSIKVDIDSIQTGQTKIVVFKPIIGFGLVGGDVHIGQNGIPGSPDFQSFTGFLIGPFVFIKN